MSVRIGFRRVGALLVALCLFGTGVAPHVHSLASTELWRQERGIAGSEVHEIACAEPTALHWHADHSVEVEPCPACLRNHFAGLPSIGTAPSSVTHARLLRSAASPTSLRFSRDSVFSRGPPVLTLDN